MFCFLSLLVFGGAIFGSFDNVFISGGLNEAFLGANDRDAFVSLVSLGLMLILADCDRVTLPDVLGMGFGGGGGAQI